MRMVRLAECKVELERAADSVRATPTSERMLPTTQPVHRLRAMRTGRKFFSDQEAALILVG